ncbi:ABC transporter substrate-binding protein [Adhaeribacter terreus]|uniref:ABC transporter substrate-binding protein n=1 Tax=Adhaeribacter terreus TaxID=529703 RepID=A0ABW0E798_9BACT
MFARFTHVFINLKDLLFMLIGVAITVLAIVQISRYFSQFYSAHYKIGIILNSVELEPEDYKVVQNVVAEKLNSINAQGGLNGRTIDALYLDDKGNPELLKKLVSESVQDENLLAYIGCKSSSRALAIASILARNNVALIGSYSLTNLTEPFPNMYSAEIGLKDLEMILHNLLQRKAKRAAFIGKKEDLYSAELLKIMEGYALKEPEFKVTSRFWFPLNYQFSGKELDMLADSLNKHNDFLLLSLEQGNTNILLEALWKRGLHIPIFCGLADIAQINDRSNFYRNGELFDVNPVGIPGVLNMKLQQQAPVFRQAINSGQKREFQLGFGGRHADEIGLLIEAASQKNLPEKADMRSKINAGLKNYIHGNQIYRGWFADWYFTQDRSFGGEPLLAWKAPDFDSPMLAPVQFLRTDSGYRQAPVLYANLDMLDISQISDEAASFYATFYLELSSVSNLTVQNIDFTNAERNKVNQAPLIEAKLVRSKKETDGNNFYHYLYKISGKFSFNPDLKKYPFDQQKFPITMQTSDALNTFLVQPPAFEFRDTVFESTGWNYLNNYIGCDQDIIAIDNNFGMLQKNIPYYKFSYVYEMQRARVDFTLKTLVPLLAILIISYLSAFIPPREFETLCAIQVTALLASIALYFSTYKPELQYATTSDKIFIFTYVMITTLLGTSILKYVMYRKSVLLKRIAMIYQRLIFPLIVIGFTIFIRKV